MTAFFPVARVLYVLFWTLLGRGSRSFTAKSTISLDMLGISLQSFCEKKSSPFESGDSEGVLVSVPLRAPPGPARPSRTRCSQSWAFL